MAGLLAITIACIGCSTPNEPPSEGEAIAAAGAMWGVDMGTTAWGLSEGLREGNPLISWADSTAGTVAAGFGLKLVILKLAEWFGGESACISAYGTLAATSLGAGAANVATILGAEPIVAVGSFFVITGTMLFADAPSGELYRLALAYCQGKRAIFSLRSESAPDGVSSPWPDPYDMNLD